MTMDMPKYNQIVLSCLSKEEKMIVDFCTLQSGHLVVFNILLIALMAIQLNQKLHFVYILSTFACMLYCLFMTFSSVCLRSRKRICKHRIDHDLCWRCGYNLYANCSDRCPECSTICNRRGANA